MSIENKRFYSRFTNTFSWLCRRRKYYFHVVLLRKHSFVWIFQVHLIFFFSGCSTHRRFVKNVRLPTIYNRLTMWTGILRMRNSSEYLWTDNNTWIILDVNGSKANDSFPNSYSSRNILIIFVYTVLFTIAAVGNLTVFVSLFRSRHRKSRISLMIRHLAIADLIVTFVMIPIEVSIFSIFIFVT